MTEEYSVTLTVRADSDRAKELVMFDLDEATGDGTLEGTAEVDMDQILTEAISGAEVSETNAPTHIALAVEHAINSK